MRAGVLLVVAVFASSSALAATSVDAPGVTLGQTATERSASLLGGVELAGSWTLSKSPALRLADDLKFAHAETPAPLDEGGGLSSDARQILALILGFVPGFGLGHLIARDRDGFLLFLIIDIALYALGVTIGWFVWKPFWGIGGLIWLVVHVIQALDAYAEAGGERIVGVLRERAVELARHDLSPHAPTVTTRLFAFSF